MSHRNGLDLPKKLMKAAIGAAIFAGEGGTTLFAASTETTVTPTPDPITQTPVAAEPPKVDLPEVVVTTEKDKVSSPKYTEPLRNIPQTITVIPKQLMQQQQATNLRDALRNVSGLTMQAGEGGNANPGDNFFIRGFSAGNDIFVDNVRDTGQYTRDAFNIEQVEVSKGPAGSYAGRGSTGGSVNLATKSPGFEGFREGSVSFGSADYIRITADVNQPIPQLEGTAARVNVMFEDTGVPGRDITERKSWGVAPAIAVGLGKPTRLVASYQYYKQDNVPDYGLPGIASTHTVNRNSYFGLVDRDYEKVVNDMALLRLEHDFNDSISLRNQLKRDRTTRDSIITSPTGGNPLAITRTGQARDRENAILANMTDVTYRFKTGPVEHALVTGIELSEEKFDDRIVTVPGAPTANMFDPNPYQPVAISTIGHSGARNEGVGKSFAAYGFNTFKIGRYFEVPVGIRWENFQTTQKVINANSSSTSTVQTDKMLSWRGGIVFKPLPIGSIYAAYGNSFNPSAELLTLNNTATLGVEPEETRAVEFGTKWDLFRQRLAVSGGVFRITKINARTPSTTGGPNVLTGEQEVEGFEIGASGQITSRWAALTSFTHQKSETKASNTVDQLGDALAWTPENSFNLWTTYQLPLNLLAGFGAQFVDTVFRNNANTQAASAPSYWVYNALLAYELNKHFTLRLNLNNLSDEYYAASTANNGRFVPGPARSVIFSTDVRF